MKTAKLVIGIVSIVLFVFIAFQSCAAGMSNALEANGEMSGTAGLITGILMMTAGIIPNRYPPVGPSMAASPPPVVNIGRPANPRKRYAITLMSAIEGGRHAAAKSAKRVCSVIGAGTSGILMKAPAAIKAANIAISTIRVICFLSMFVIPH